MRTITRREWVWAATASIVVLAFSSLPYAAGYAAQNEQWVFGGAIFDRMDYNVRLAGIQTGLRGVWESQLLHTSERVPPAYVILFYVLVGQVGRWLPLTPPALFELSRWLFGLWALLTMYAFAARFLPSVAMRRFAFALMAAGSGVGWLMLAVGWLPDRGISPIDFWLVDLYGFFSIQAFPHFSAVMAALWTAALAFLSYWETRRTGWLTLGILCSLAAQATQPFAPMILDAALGGYLCWQWVSKRKFDRAQFWSVIWLAASQLPLLAYSASVFYGDPIWRGFSAQNYTPSPPPIYYALGLGLIGALAVWGGWLVARRRKGEARLPLAWVLMVAVLAYLPLQFQRRFTEAVIAPLAVLAAIGVVRGALPLLRQLGLRQLLARLNYPYRRARGTVLLLAAAFCSLSSAYLVAASVAYVADRPRPLFDPLAVVAAVDWLGENSDWQDTVFSAEPTGGMIPARIGHRVYLGHPIETVNYADKLADVESFFDSRTDDAARRLILNVCRCRYVFYGADEQALGDFDLTGAAYLRLAHNHDGVQIFEVIR